MDWSYFASKCYYRCRNRGGLEMLLREYFNSFAERHVMFTIFILELHSNFIVFVFALFIKWDFLTMLKSTSFRRFFKSTSVSNLKKLRTN